jgi:hypothetical protein
MTFFYKWLPRLYGIAAIFWVLIYWIEKYTRVEVVEETHTTLGIIPLVMIGMLIAIVSIGGFVLALLSWWESIKKDRLSFKTFLPFYILIIGIMVLGMLGVNKLSVLIELNTAQFILDLQGYNITMRNSLYILSSGIVISGGGLAWEIIRKSQQP